MPVFQQKEKDGNSVLFPWLGCSSVVNFYLALSETLSPNGHPSIPFHKSQYSRGETNEDNDREEEETREFSGIGTKDLRGLGVEKWLWQRAAGELRMQEGTRCSRSVREKEGNGLGCLKQG